MVKEKIDQEAGADSAGGTDREARSAAGVIDRREQWRARLEEAWPHLRAALCQRMEQGESIAELAGVVVEHPGDGEPFVTVGVLRREELAETLEEGAAIGPRAAQWAGWLRQPAPVGCVPVFGALEGHSEVCVLGPVVPFQLN